MRKLHFTQRHIGVFLLLTVTGVLVGLAVQYMGWRFVLVRWITIFIPMFCVGLPLFLGMELLFAPNKS